MSSHADTALEALSVVMNHDNSHDMALLKAQVVISEGTDGLRRITSFGHRFLTFLFSRNQPRGNSTFVFKPSQLEIFWPHIVQLVEELEEDLGESAEEVIGARVDRCFANGWANCHLMWWLYEGFEEEPAERTAVMVADLLTAQTGLRAFLTSGPAPHIELFPKMFLNSKVFDKVSETWDWDRALIEKVKRVSFSPWPDVAFNAFMEACV